MTDTVDLLVWGEPPASWGDGEVVALSATSPMASIADRVESHLGSTTASWLLFWDPAFGTPDPTMVQQLCAGRADAWHSGLLQGLAGVPEEHDYIQPTWTLALDADPGIDSASWRLSLGALLVKTDGVVAVDALLSLTKQQ